MSAAVAIADPRFSSSASTTPAAARWPQACWTGSAPAGSGFVPPGSDPAETVNPAAVEAMAEVGIDLSKEFPKPLTADAVRVADVVITMGCGDACPIFPGKRYEDWELDDPAGRPVEEVRVIRDDIERRVEALLETLARS